MIISSYDATTLSDAFGIDMSTIDGLWVGAGWGRVAPGQRSDPHQHDETETFVIVQGHGTVVVDGAEQAVSQGTVVQFEPFETHVVTNTGDTDLIFATFYWRDAVRAAQQAAATNRRRFAERPIFVFSTPPTPNGDLHLGHLSGPYLGADVFVRFQRMNGTHAWHLTGSDDFQSYTVERARQDGRSPAETAAHFSAEIAATLSLMDIPIDQYTVTNADTAYAPMVQAFFSRLVGSGKVALNEASALFDSQTGDYLYEVDVSGTCPHCGSGTGGNICEECGEPNSCADLREPDSIRSELPPRVGTITRYSLPLHEFRSEVSEHHQLGRVPARLRELADRLFRRPRFDVAITHPSQWGIRPTESDVDGQVIWVWPEMSYGFLHGIEALGKRLGQPWQASEPEQDWKIVHFFGYDNSFYHSLLYPVLYRLAYPQWEPDIDYHVNEFLLLDNAKFSTSRQHAIWGKEVLSPQTVDAVRFFLCRIRSEGQRTNFEWAAFESEVSHNLIGVWQHWLHDLGARVQANYSGAAPDAGIWTPEQIGFLRRLGVRLEALTNCLGPDGFSLNQAAEELNGIVADTVRFGRQEARMAGSDLWHSQTRTAIALELAAARLLAHAAMPVLPRFAARLAAALGMAEPKAWPQTVELVPVGSRIALAGVTFFGALTQPTEADDNPVRAWLSDLVCEVAQPSDAQSVGSSSLVSLGISSMQIVALQYRILQTLGVDVTVEELLGEVSTDTLADSIAERSDPAQLAELAKPDELVRV